MHFPQPALGRLKNNFVAAERRAFHEPPSTSTADAKQYKANQRQTPF
jgi:hypothetical protein